MLTSKLLPTLAHKALSAAPQVYTAAALAMQKTAASDFAVSHLSSDFQYLGLRPFAEVPKKWRSQLKSTYGKTWFVATQSSWHNKRVLGNLDCDKLQKAYFEKEQVIVDDALSSEALMELQHFGRTRHPQSNPEVWVYMPIGRLSTSIYGSH